MFDDTSVVSSSLRSSGMISRTFFGLREDSMIVAINNGAFFYE
jgi:hypothetical protein